jgi:Ca2+-dependent lipid-binding protein
MTSDSKCTAVVIKYPLTVHAPCLSLSLIPNRCALRMVVVNVQVISARDLKNVEVIGKMDPYVTVKLGEQVWKSRVHHGGGRAPRWNDSTTLMYGGEQEISFTVFCHRT